VRPGILRYIDRIDKQESFESNVTSWLEDNVAILGFPGVGKSASAKAIVAKYIEIHHRKKPGIVMSISQTKKPEHRIELIKFKDSPIIVPVPVVSVPFASTNEEEILKELISSVGSFEKILKDLSNTVNLLSSKLESAENFNKIRDMLTNVLDPKTIPTQLTEMKELAESISDAIPYVGTALKISKMIFEYIRGRKVENLQDRDALIVVDDVADLGNNWEILSRITRYEFHYLFVMRVGPKHYTSMLRDPEYSSAYLKSTGLPIKVGRYAVIPPPTLEIFSSIMRSHDVDQESKIDNLWKCTGGIPAVALMISEETNTDEDLQMLLNKVHDKLNDDTQVISWDTENTEIRLAYTFYSVRVIYEDLKKKNLAFAALCCQPDGVGAEELALFCALSTYQLYTFGNRKVEELYEKIKPQYETQYNAIRLDTHPHNGSESYDYVMDRNIEYRKIVEKTVEKWGRNRSERASGDPVHEAAASIGVENKDQLVYGFNGLFQHIPALLKEAEELYDDLHNDLNATRERLLMAMEQLVVSTELLPTFRVLRSAYDHIEKLDDLSNVKKAVTTFMSLIYSSNRLLYEGYDDENMIDKILASVQGNDVYTAQFLLSLSHHASHIAAVDKDYGSDLAEQIIAEFENLDLNDRVVLFMYSCSMIIIGRFYDRSDLFQPEQLEDYVNLICSTCQDSICMFTKASILPDITAMYLGEEHKQHCKSLLSEAEHAIQVLEKSDLAAIKKITSIISPRAELLLLKAKLNELIAVWYLGSHDLKQSADRYAKAASDFEKLGVDNNRFSNVDNLLKVRLLDSENDKEFRSVLGEIAKLSDEMEKDTGDLRDLSPEILIRNYTHVHLARVALKSIYKRLDSLRSVYNQNSNLPDFIDPISSIRTYVASCCIEKIINGTFSFNEFVRELLPFFASIDFTKTRSLMAEDLFKMTQQNKDDIAIVDADGEKRLTINDIKEDILASLDDWNKNLQNNEFINCKFYRDGTNDGLLKEWVCSMVNIINDYSEDAVSRISIHLLFDNYQQCISMLTMLSMQGLASIPVLNYLVNKMICAINNYTTAQKNKEIYGKELAKTYLQFYFCCRE
jgi:hypothetical protein